MGRRSRKQRSTGAAASAAEPSAPAAVEGAGAKRTARDEALRATERARPRERRGPSAIARDDAQRRAARGRSRREEAPLAPWGRFPLVELCVLAAIALAVAGAIVRGHAGGVLLVGAALLGSVAGLEVALREHLGGYRSHTTLLAGVGAIGVMALLHFGPRLHRETIVPVAVVVFGLGFIGWRALFKKRSGGFGVKVR